MIAGAEANVDMLELARAAARAQCDLAQIRCLKNALLNPISALTPRKAHTLYPRAKLKLASQRTGGDIERDTVQTRTLDSFSFHNVGFIKIDIEGHELAVISGARNTIEQSRPAFLIECEERNTPGGLNELRRFSIVYVTPDFSSKTTRFVRSTVLTTP